MATKTAKKTKESIKLIKKRSGRWSVKGANGSKSSRRRKAQLLQLSNPRYNSKRAVSIVSKSRHRPLG